MWTKWAGSDLQFQLALATGRFPSLTGGVINGANPAVGSTWEDVHDLGGVFPFLETQGVCHVSSGSASDTGTGTGARTVLVEGTSTDGTWRTVVATLAGATPVPVGSWQHVWKVSCQTFGSGETNAGAITVARTAGDVALVQALAGMGVSQNTVFRVPTGKHFIIGTFFFNTNNGTNTVSWRFCVRQQGSGGWVCPATFYQGDNAPPVELRPWPALNVFPPGSTVKWQSRAPAGTVETSTGMTYMLLDI
jgi:hypothetical protein